MDWGHLIQPLPDLYGGSHGRAFGKRVNGYDPDMTEPELLPDYVLRNRAYWDEVDAPRYAEPGRRAWARDEFTLGHLRSAGVGPAGAPG